MKFFVYLMTLLFVGTAIAQNPTILQGNYISNVFGNSNFVLNPNALTNVANVTNATRSTTTPLVATSEFTLSLASGANATWTLRAFDGGMKGQNCEARFTYRGFATATTTAQIVQNSLVVAQLVLTPTTDPRIASINFPCGDLANLTTFRIAQTTANMTGTNEIGGIYVGLATNMANVAQAEMVGGGEWTTSTGFTRSSSAIQSTFAAFTSGSAGTAVGKATSAGSDTTITFPYLPAGQYYVSTNFYNYLYLGGVNNANCEFTIQEIDSNTNSAISSSGAFSITSIYPPASSLQGNFNFTTGGQRRFRIVSRNTIANGAGSLCVSLPDASVKAGIYVYRFPSSSELVVTPERAAIKYASNTGGEGTAANTNYTNSTYFSSAENGSTVPAITQSVANTTTCYDASFGEAIKTTDTVKLQYAAGTTEKWTDIDSVASGVFPFMYNAAKWYGIYVDIKTPSTGLIQICFGNSGRYALGTYGSTTTTDYATWASANSSGHRYRAVKVPASASNSALYVQGPVKAAETGAAIPAGSIGEEKRAVVTTNTNFPTSGQWGDATSISLTPGVWDVSANLMVDNASYTATVFSIAITSTSGNSSTGNSPGDNNFTTYPGNLNTPVSLAIPQYRILVTSTTTYYLKVTATYSTGTPQYRGRISAVRIN